MVQVFKSEGFVDEKSGIDYGFFGRQGGQSEGLYAWLNCGAGSNDEAGAVEANRAAVAGAMSVSVDRLFTPYQVHSAVCARVDRGGFVGGGRPEADALVTDQTGVAIGIVTADCAPVLFYAEREGRGGVIGAAHAGWRGAIGGVLEATIQSMLAYDGVVVENIRACIGPCIGRASYEVDLAFYKNFVQQNEDYDAFFSSGQAETKFMFDLGGFCGFRLREAGVSQVSIMDCDTYVREADFFSYRRMTHRKESDYGRQISAIALRDVT
jgi:YfiH family protein